jgi:AraC-like DNA-binding protein
MLKHAVFGDYAHDLPVIDGGIVQLGRGDATLLSERTGGQDTVLSRLRVEPRLIGALVPDPDWLAIVVPFRWRGDYRFNGQVARLYDVFVSSGPNGYVTIGEGRDTVGVGIRKSRLQAACAALQGVGPEEVQFADIHIALGPTSGRQLHSRLAALIASSLDAALRSGQSTLGAVLEDDFISDIGALLTQCQFDGRSRPPAKLNSLRIVRAAVKAADASATNTLSMADLCAATGVGQTWLHRAFTEIYDTSPMKVMRARRLAQVRKMFLDPTQPPPSVKYAALSLGFMESGRFARDYRALFGENPAETLRSRGQKVALSTLPGARARGSIQAPSDSRVAASS